MKTTRTLSIFSLLSLVLILGLALTGCSTDSATPLSDETVVPNVEKVTATEALTATATLAATTGDCLVGSWMLTDFSAYMDSIKNDISQDSGGDFTITSGDFTGSATLDFNPDHTSSFVSEDFSQSFAVGVKISDQTMEIPVTLIINGKSTADYSIEEKNITFSNQNENDMLIAIDVAGSVTTLTQSMFGEPGTQELYQYDCVDANTLSLKVLSVDNMDLAPLILTRLQ